MDFQRTVPSALRTTRRPAKGLYEIEGAGSGFGIARVAGSLNVFGYYDPYDPFFTADTGQPWDPATVYSAGDIVLYSGAYYKAGVTANNLVPNPSFEHDAVSGRPALWEDSDVGWSYVSSGSTLTVVSTAPFIGSNCLHVDGAGGHPGAVIPLGILPAGPYEGTAYVKQSSPAGLQILFNIGLPGLASQELTNLTSSWVQLYNSFNADGVHPAFLSVNGQANGDFYLDAVMIAPGEPQLPYKDGDTTNWMWAGTPGASIQAVPPSNASISGWTATSVPALQTGDRASLCIDDNNRCWLVQES